MIRPFWWTFWKTTRSGLTGPSRNCRHSTKVHRLVINPIIYSELSLSFSTVESLDKAFAQYRRSGGVKHNVLGNIFIGAHATVSGLPLLTRDARRYSNYFPSVKLVTPE